MTGPEAEVPPSTGLVGGKYQLVKLIGRGGMGSVWEGRHANLGTQVAIKFIEAEYANSAEARSRFDKEAKAAATIQSKHAIQVFDNGVTEDGKPYIVMELLQGEPLDKRIERLGRLTLQDTARILQQVCRGLSKAHERGIIHRDLKPENVFIVHNNDDDDEVAKVLDFGIAKVAGTPGNPGVTSSTKTGAVLGTPFYMSPEQARGLRNVDHRTDVWSLGVIAFKCITGRLPFDGESVGDLLVKICTAPVPVPSHIAPGIPVAFDTWFLRALEREPDRRFSNVLELSEHLSYAAGIGPRGPVSSQDYGPAATALAPSQNPPFSGGYAQGYSSQAPGPQGGPYGPPPALYTPNPAGMTNAPFTSSQPVPVAGGRARWYVGAAVAGLLLAILATVAVAKLKRDDGRATASNTVGLTQSAPPPLPTDKPLPPGDPQGTATGTPTLAAIAPSSAGSASSPAVSASVAKASPAPKPAKPSAHAGAGGPPVLPPPGTGAASTVVATAPPPPPPSAKKPAKGDPGY
ncbi:MAG: serine/threonine protein kinase [Labilithrix sp.]|nr:serine/threonine protein kinase [Labilithrix sp.]